MQKPSESSPEKKPVELLRRREFRPLVPRAPAWRDHRAWLSSCIVHTLLLVSVAWLWQPQSGGTGDSVDRPIGIALAHELNGRDEFFLSGGGARAPAESEAEKALLSALKESASAVDSAGPPVSISELMSGLIGTDVSGSLRGGAGDGLSGLGTGASGTGVGQSKSATTFMGLRGTGTSFVYVLDRSASMLEFEGAPMRFAKRELLNSIQSLTPKNQFQVVFYNESPGSLNPGASGGKLLQANELNKDKAVRFVKAIAAQGGTEHIPGLKMGLSFTPDVLFFLTDAAEPAMSEAQLLELQARADRSLTTIHAIQFNRGPETNDGGWIRALAEMNRGSYRYVDILSLDEARFGGPPNR